MPHKPTETYKMSSTVPDKSGIFKLPMRLPGWHPDGVSTGAAGAPPQPVFPDEALKCDSGKFIPFDPLNGGIDWILGWPIRPSAKKDDFPAMVWELARLVRNYNASLYRLRRLHLYRSSKGEIRMKQNPDGGDPDLPNPITGQNSQGKNFQQLATDAETDWTKVIEKINTFLDEQHMSTTYKLTLVAVDMVEVNSYIVSMRVVAEDLVSKGGPPVNELPGSSSSHVSIDSTFSSSVP